jgi:hypothetical protein
MLFLNSHFSSKNSIRKHLTPLKTSQLTLKKGETIFVIKIMFNASTIFLRRGVLAKNLFGKD